MKKVNELIEPLLVKLKAANVQQGDKKFTTIKRPDDNLVILAYVPKTLEVTLPMPFPFETRYVAFFLSSIEALPVTAYYLIKPFDLSQNNDIFPTGNYSDTEKGHEMLFHHVVEHLVMGAEPVSMKSKMLQ